MKYGASAPTRDLSIRTVKRDFVYNEGAHSSIASCDSDEILTGGGSEHKGGDFRLAYSKPVGNSWDAKSFPLSQRSFIHSSICPMSKVSIQSLNLITMISFQFFIFCI